MLSGLRNEDSPPLIADRLAAGEAIDAPLPRRVRRLRDRIGDLAGVLIIAGLVWAVLVAIGGVM